MPLHERHLFMLQTLPAILQVKPFTRPVRGDVTLPGSKSLTNRALLLAALCQNKVTLTGALFSEDTHLMTEALKELGFAVNTNPEAHTIEVSGQTNGFKSEKPVDIFVGLAGTAARFLTALCAAAPRGVYRIDGIPQMRKRPMKGLIDALRTLGADIRCTGVEGFFPLEIHARGLRGGAVSIHASESSQMYSALLMVAPLADTEVKISLIGSVRQPFVDMTKFLMMEFGQAIGPSGDNQPTGVTPGSYQFDCDYPIEPDATAASYFEALPLIGGVELYIPGLSGVGLGLQGDSRFLEIVEMIGARVSPRYAENLPSGMRLSLGTDISFTPLAQRNGVTQNFNEFSDTFLTLAAIAPLLSGKTTITGIAHSRKQETDRVSGMVKELRKLLGDENVDEHADGDGLTITPNLSAMKERAAKGLIEIETYGDHRFAMSFAILGCHDLHGNGQPWLSIKDPACCAKTFPNFFELLETKRKESLSS